MSRRPSKEILVKEAALFTGLLFIGLVVAPLVIYWLGPRVIGEFGGHGYADFFGTISAKIRSGDLTAWFFVLSPWLAWQVVRLTALAWRKTGGM
jgi:hypothetical protein